MTRTLERRVLEWMASGDSGISAETIVSVMMNLPFPVADVPYTAADFARCHRLLAKIPEFRARLPEVAERYPAWEPLVRNWDRLSEIYTRDTTRISPELDRVLSGLLLRGCIREASKPAHYVLQDNGEVGDMELPLMSVVRALKRPGDMRSALAIPGDAGLVHQITPHGDLEVLGIGGRSFAVVLAFPPFAVQFGESKVIELIDRWDVRVGEGPGVIADAKPRTQAINCHSPGLI